MRSLIRVAVLLLSIVAFAGGESALAGTTEYTTTGAISTSEAPGELVLVNQAYQCNAPVDLAYLSVTLNSDYVGTQADAIKLGPGCTGIIHYVNVSTAIADGIKISGSHDLTIGGGIVDCYDHGLLAHQDGTQVLAGTNITYEGVIFNCHSANNSDFYLEPSKGPITNVVCNHCWFFGTQSSSAYVLDQVINSGITNSTICPSRYFTYRHNTAVDINNVYPTDC